MDDTRLVQLRRSLEVHAAQRCQRDSLTREAGVALLIRPRDQLELLMIKRAIHERDPWSGHMALPGGRRAAGDAELIDTAIRETSEEVGITLGRDRDFVAALDEVGPRTPRLPPIIISPFVFAVAPDATATIDAREVEAAIWMPLAALRDENAASEILIELEGSPRAFPSLQYGEYVIWGLTHRILTQFLDLTVGL